MPTTGQQRVPLEEAWRIATGQEFPVLTEEEIAEIDAKIAAADEVKRRIWGDRPDSTT
jgi:hypothetical protein